MIAISDPRWSELIHGTTADGQDVTARFGQGGNEGHTLLSDGHKPLQDFTGASGNRGHDHYDGQGGGTQRDQYTGYGS